jgi:hypothetical protein
MKVKTILGVVIALTLILSLSLTVMAGKPIPELTVGSITYSVNYTGQGIDQVLVNNISWQNAHPRLIIISVKGDSFSNSSQTDAPKGKAGKYPQDITHDILLTSDHFDIGEQVEVKVLLARGNYFLLHSTDVLYTLTWGTSSNWTAP